jgi:ankyrin repeat protein
LELDPFYRETEDDNGNTGLHLACKAGHLNIVKALMGAVKEHDENYKFVNKRNQVS